MEKIINGKALALQYQDDIINFIKEREATNLRLPAISLIQVGNDGGSNYYRESVKKLCEKLKITVKECIYEENIEEKVFLDSVKAVDEDINVDGILMLMPLPKHIDSNKAIDQISQGKDIDGLTDNNIGKFYSGKKAFIPCTAKAVLAILESLPIELEGKNVVVLGRSNVVGKPVSNLLIGKNATVTTCHSKTENLKEVCKRADILVAAIGKPKFIGNEYVKEGAIVIDVGTTYYEGKLTGDVNFDEVSELASFITPVPGGVGALTTTMLLSSLCEACKNNV
ncbi:bifunctional 5,10-methylenetetrahydrofolate dehydrogenase/5,10-methenyltetrahydrofolate cyclohydrolase [Clostridium cellulovorans]|uniref:Bifunctional protein FolD n=1 Tax=Clostridium cellulovorans (strain ATCC 35296 / DSM 3052 / OCM 3 / 743B) TaxID=573061 RepID=D9SLU6_CLOC7|nr:tetrahydrofolate dehydrogenase/cyclohydrolase catalytic domain-containing protein [Clostridium cellulovorans]ADL51677.1 Methylenetetrahydrofolate dehydrogenase (NADP(+)) [Clostridium cellulovorans 743B]